MKSTWKLSLAGIALALGVPAYAQEAGWRAVPVATAPAATIGRPVAAQTIRVGPTDGWPAAAVQRAPEAAPRGAATGAAKAPSVVVGKPVAPKAVTGRPVVRAAMAEDVPFPPPPPLIQVAGVDPMLDSGSPPPGPSLTPAVPFSVSRQGPPDAVAPPAGGPVSPPDLIPGVEPSHPVGPRWWENWGGWMTWGDRPSGKGHKWCSDTCFPGLISPITMPFYFEDPRALTEIRPIFMYQSIPGSTPNVGGGSAWFFGTQARLAFDDRFSLVINELGMVGLSPSNDTGPLQDKSGFAEVKIGPKYTFLKYSDWGSVAAAGLTFQLPVGSGDVYQNVGTLSLVPYLSYGQTFGRFPGGFGSLNFMGTTGYSLSVDNDRAEFFYLNLHLDYNVANSNSWYPTLELNWIHYTKAGNNPNLNFEGADLINFGAQQREGSNYFTVAPGLRYRFNDHVYLGAAVEVPFGQERALNDYRLTFDMIFRY